MEKDNHTITQRLKELYTVRNNRDGNIYTVDIALPSCTCPAFRFNKRNKKGKKKICKHIKIARGIKEIKLR